MKNRYPTTEELYAFELEARRLRAAEMARLFKVFKEYVSNLFSTRVFRHA